MRSNNFTTRLSSKHLHDFFKSTNKLSLEWGEIDHKFKHDSSSILKQYVFTLSRVDSVNNTEEAAVRVDRAVETGATNIKANHMACLDITFDLVRR
ncbi:hypothetical protein L3X38_012856 [Prunus dulcis]|uniref:Uncharacterized protein n=1 Tax=Prunus dulcis TaxID=3755 RepID=A0AAD4ZGG6_PRUDU|nr:hypothetical protein L3X38_012856 [Prunus dulcis]